MLKIRLSLRGKRGQRSFRLVVIDSRRKRDSGNYLVDVGFYNPNTKEMRLDKDNIQKWLNHGAQPTSTVQSLLKKQHDL